MSEEKSVAKPKIKLLERLKGIKHIEIIVVAIFAIVMILIYLSTFSSGSDNKIDTGKNYDNSLTAYIENMEDDLEKIISQIKGVSNASVFITLDLSNAQVVDNVVKYSAFPPIKGVIVVAKGVNDLSVKMNVLKAIEAVIQITNGNIEILVSN